jgi:hypothetical protein
MWLGVITACRVEVKEYTQNLGYVPVGRFSIFRREMHGLSRVQGSRGFAASGGPQMMRLKQTSAVLGQLIVPH